MVLLHKCTAFNRVFRPGYVLSPPLYPSNSLRQMLKDIVVFLLSNHYRAQVSTSCRLASSLLVRPHFKPQYPTKAQLEC